MPEPQARAFYDFFAGVGMAELALAPEWRCAWANDIDPGKAEIYRANHDPSVFYLGDVAAVTAADLPHGAAMAWASFPCQDLSLAGWRRGMGADRSGTFWAFWRLMRELQGWGRRPPLIVVENVIGLLHGPDFSGLCEALAALDMQFGALAIDAKWFLPQSRPRVFVVGVDARLDVADLIERRPADSPWFDTRIRAAHNALDSRLRRHWRWWRLPTPEMPAPAITSLMFDDPVGVRWHAKAETGRLLTLMSAVNLAKVERARRQPGRSIGFLYRRTRADGQRAEVRFDGLSGCLRTSAGGSSRQTVVVVEDGEVRTRLLAAREAARLMGLPDSFWLPDRYNAAYHAIGDGVAVPAAAWLGAHLLTPLADRLSEAVAAPTWDSVDSRAYCESAEARARVWLANRG